jgi:hypothetical protein
MRSSKYRTDSLRRSLVRPLSEVPEALRYLGEGHAKGEAVVIVE